MKIDETNVRQVWDLSTAHVTEKDNDHLEFGFPSLPFRVAPHEYGWVIFLREDFPDSDADKLLEMGFSGAFVAILRAANNRGFLLINFDRDADVDENLPTFTW